LNELCKNYTNTNLWKWDIAYFVMHLANLKQVMVPLAFGQEYLQQFKMTKCKKN